MSAILILPDGELLLRVGCKVDLRPGYYQAGINKPYPIGWHEVAEVGPRNDADGLPTIFRVVSDPRWLPVRAIKEIVL